MPLPNASGGPAAARRDPARNRLAINPCPSFAGTPQRPERYEADEIDFAVRNISGNTQLSAGTRRAWPSRTASRSEMYDRYWRVLNVSVELFENSSDLAQAAP